MAKTKAHKGWYGLEYVTVFLPEVKTASGQEGVHALAWKDATQLVAKAIVARRIPIRGKEFLFLRKSVSLSLASIGASLGLSATALHKWEKSPEKRLDPVNEVAVRSLFSELLKVSMPGAFGSLIGMDEPEEIEIRTAS